MVSKGSDHSQASGAEVADPPRSGTARLLALSLAALGVVYGDIGTSPLYAFRECFGTALGVAPTPLNVLGVLSLVFWSLILVISVKYQLFVMRADNRGEGGILALLALLDPWRGTATRRFSLLVMLGVFGASLLYGDGVITPAISVLSAVEGLQVAEPRLQHFILPLTIIILLGLFALQRRGTGHVGAVFGPIMLVWFSVLGLLGVLAMRHDPLVLRAVDPRYGIAFLRGHGELGLLVLGAVFLTVTGGEALYADMGHFGRNPIRVGWFGLVLPALLLNYFGQGALLLSHPGRADHPFYGLVAHWALYPMIALATVATIIASQAVISGAFSLMRQAVQLGQTPRVRIIQTSSEEIGQVYIPTLNWMLMIATVSVVLLFRSSSALAAAYGIAISLTMVITTILLFFAMRRRWLWPTPLAAFVTGCFLTVDVPFFGANLLKMPQGGWLPITGALFVFLIMSTWSSGRRNLIGRLRRDTLPLEQLMDTLEKRQLRRVAGTAVFMTAPKLGAPPVMQRLLKYAEVLHEQVIMLTVITEDRPRVPVSERLDLLPLRNGFYRVFVRYGFMQEPNLLMALARLRRYGLELDLDTTTFFIGRETLIITDDQPWLWRWRDKLYAFMFRNALRATDFYKLPPKSAVEIGIWLEASAAPRKAS